MISFIAIVLCTVILILATAIHFKSDSILLKISSYYFFIASLIGVFVVREFEKETLMPIILYVAFALLFYPILFIWVNQLVDKQRAIFEQREVVKENRLGARVCKIVIVCEILLLGITFVLESLTDISLAHLFVLEKVVCVMLILTVLVYVQLYYKKRNL